MPKLYSFFSRYNLLAGILGLTLISLPGCAGDKAQVAGDLTTALDVASTVEGAYAASSKADPAKVAELSRLLATAQAAVAAWQASSLPSDQAIASAAISALVEYEASAGAK